MSWAQGSRRYLDRHSATSRRPLYHATPNERSTLEPNASSAVMEAGSALGINQADYNALCNTSPIWLSPMIQTSAPSPGSPYEWLHAFIELSSGREPGWGQDLPIPTMSQRSFDEHATNSPSGPLSSSVDIPTPVQEATEALLREEAGSNTARVEPVQKISSHDPKAVACRLGCKGTFTRRSDMERHVHSAVIHQGQAMASDSSRNGSPGSSSRLQCGECDGEFARRDVFLRHMQHAHQTYVKRNKRGRKSQSN